jgi:hypothetical protein
MDTRSDSIGVFTNTLLFSWFNGLADNVEDDEVHPEDRDAMQEWLSSDDGADAAGDLAEKLVDALDAAGLVIVRKVPA